MNKRIMLAGVLAVALTCQSAGAKTLEEVLKEKGVITEADYNEIVKSAPKSTPVAYKLGQGMTFTSPDEQFQLIVGGQMQMRYTFFEKDGVGVGNSSEWKLPRIKTIFRGYAFTKDLTYLITPNWANLNTKIAGGASDTSKVLEETYLNYRIVDEAQIRVGQDKIYYSRNWLNPSSQQQFVDTAFVTDAFRPGYDIGLGVNGSALKGMLTYGAQWMGGKGQNTTSTNNNNSYDVRIAVNPLGEMKYTEADIDMSSKPLLGIGGTYYYNTLKKTAAGTFESNNLNYANSSTGWLGKNAASYNASENVNVSTFETDMAFKWQGLSLQGEYFWGEGVGQTTQKTVVANGFYAQAGYMVLPKTVELAVRYAWMDYNKSLTNSLKSEVQGAISWYVKGHNLKLQADVTKTNMQANAVTDSRSGAAYITATSPLSDTTFRAQAQLLF